MILFLHVCLVLASAIGILLGVISLVGKDSDRWLAGCAIAVNLLPLASLAVKVVAAF